MKNLENENIEEVVVIDENGNEVVAECETKKGKIKNFVIRNGKKLLIGAGAAVGGAALFMAGRLAGHRDNCITINSLVKDEPDEDVDVGEDEDSDEIYEINVEEV